MADVEERNTWRLYRDLSWLWPLWGDPDGEYRDWCDHVTRLIRGHARRPTRTLLNMGCGGGKNAYNLKRDFAVTGIDISPAMLEQARQLNPECTFIEADMRDCDLGQWFDAVLIDDAVSYMINREELRAVFAIAWKHLAPGGVLVVGPDDTVETFRQNATSVSHAAGSTKPDDIDVVFVENAYDPDPDDETYEGTMVYLIRENGRLRVETDHHLLGLFPKQVWRDTLEDVGLEVSEDSYTEGEKVYANYVCVKP